MRTEVPLARLTTLKLGGPAAQLVEASSAEGIAEAVSQGPFLVLGGGSNLVVADQGFDGRVVRIASRGVKAERDGDRVRVEVAAGEPWDQLVARAVDEGWSGVECLSGIPGLVGATPIQNVGAYGQEVAETIVKVRVFDRVLGALVDLDPRQCGFAYRTSVFKTTDRFVVTDVTFAFPRRSAAPIRYAELARALSIGEGASAPSRRVREAVIALRRDKGMVLDPADSESVSAGSFFTNPIVDASTLAEVERRAGDLPRFAAGAGRWKLSAGWLVENAGFVKGYAMGNVGVSRKHALALVNRGGTTRELLSLARAIVRGVQERFGVVLTPEPVLVGCSL